jgi:hypothetical protein
MKMIPVMPTYLAPGPLVTTTVAESVFSETDGSTFCFSSAMPNRIQILIALRATIGRSFTVPKWQVNSNQRIIAVIHV